MGAWLTRGAGAPRGKPYRVTPNPGSRTCVDQTPAAEGGGELARVGSCRSGGSPWRGTPRRRDREVPQCAVLSSACHGSRHTTCTSLGHGTHEKQIQDGEKLPGGEEKLPGGEEDQRGEEDQDGKEARDGQKREATYSAHQAPPRPSAEPDRGPRHEPSGISNRPIGEERARQARVPARRTRKDPKETAMEMTAPMPVGESNPPDEGQNDREEVAAEHSSWMANPDAPFRRARRPAGGNARLGPGGG
jgi:hypothetical protein